MKTLISAFLSVTIACSGAAGASQPGECNENTEVETVAEVAPAAVGMTASRADQVLYKGVVGNLLETVPLDPDRRVELQRTNAVISNPLTGRSLAVLLGVASPVLMIAGLVWGIWAASQISKVAVEAGNDPVPPPSNAAEASLVVALD